MPENENNNTQNLVSTRDEEILEQLTQISKKLDGLNKCSISTVQMAKKVYAGLEDLKQVTGNFRAEIGKFHTTASDVTQDLKQVDYAIVSMHKRIDESCSELEDKTCSIMKNMMKEQEKAVMALGKQFLNSLQSIEKEGNPFNLISDLTISVRNMVFVLYIINLILLTIILFR